MKIVFTVVFVLSIVALAFILITPECEAKDVVTATPWTYDAATFNPKGVKWAGGVTSGDELRDGHYIKVSQEGIDSIRGK